MKTIKFLTAYKKSGEHVPADEVQSVNFKNGEVSSITLVNGNLLDIEDIEISIMEEVRLIT